MKIECANANPVHLDYAAAEACCLGGQPTRQFDAQPVVADIINGHGDELDMYDMDKLMTNLYALNGKSWNVSALDSVLLVEIIRAHKK